MPRSIWTGTISFGLVNVPVRAYTAVKDHDVHFHQLDAKSGARVRNKRVSEKTGREVDADDIELGFEIRKGRYVTFEKDEVEDLKPASTRSATPAGKCRSKRIAHSRRRVSAKSTASACCAISTRARWW